MEIVLQGPLDSYALTVANTYLECEFISKVIISCWDKDPELTINNDRITILRNIDVSNPGVGNRNRQIFTSFNGLNQVTSDICAKMRTDQLVSISSLHMMRDFFSKFEKSELGFFHGGSPKGRVFVTSLFRNYPFHPRDHIFWGYTSDLLQVFDIPFCSIPFPGTVDESYYADHTRAETYIGSYYYSKFDYEITEYINNPLQYLVDNALERPRVMEKYYQIGEKVFKTFPAIQMEWPKRGLKFYPYYGHNPHGEFWDESPWRFNG